MKAGPLNTDSDATSARREGDGRHLHLRVHEAARRQLLHVQALPHEALAVRLVVPRVVPVEEAALLGTWTSEAVDTTGRAFQRLTLHVRRWRFPCITEVGIRAFQRLSPHEKKKVGIPL